MICKTKKMKLGKCINAPLEISFFHEVFEGSPTLPQVGSHLLEVFVDAPRASIIIGKLFVGLKVGDTVGEDFRLAVYGPLGEPLSLYRRHSRRKVW